MNFTRNKFVRFEDWSSERSLSSETQISTEDGLYPKKNRKAVSSVLKSIRRGFESGSERIKSLGKSLSFHWQSDQPANEGSGKKILDPEGAFLQKWNKIFVLSCVITVSLDPLFFYVPVIDGKRQCLSVDRTLVTTACVLRSLADIFYMLHIIFQFRTGFIAPSSRVFGRGELVENPSAIMKRYLSSYFIIDILSVLPLPQVLVLAIIPRLKGPDWLKFIILSQCVPRLIRIYPLYKEVTRTSGILTETALAGATLNLFLYMLASHVVGAFWYLFSIERKVRCWRDACRREPICNYTQLYCGEHHTGDNAFLNASCPLIDPDEIKDSTIFNFGIFLDALQSRVVESKDFPQKFSYCFWWGLQNLGSLGQNLKTSTFVWEIVFAVFISIFGLTLFSLLIGNMQKHLQSITVNVDSRIEEMREERRDVERRDVEHWMNHRNLPESLRERIRQYEQYKWQETRGVEEETLIRNLPIDLRRDIKRHICLSLLRRVPMFEEMNEVLLGTMCDHLKPVLHTKGSYIVHEGDLVLNMFFIIQGNLLSLSTNCGRNDFFNSDYLNAGDFCGEELLPWALDSNSSNLPISTRTVKALTKVEAYALMADDLKCVASQFQRFHSKQQLQHTFRFYSQQWRTWAACFIQATWHQYCKRKLEKSLREEENRLQDALSNDAGTSSPSLGATIYASKFVVNALRNLRHNGAHYARLPQRLLPLLPQKLPQKPAEPDFYC